jgi:L-fucose isomerase-like protein
MKLDAATMDAKDTRIAELEYQNKSMEKYVTEGIAFRDDLQVRCATLEQAIKKIYTTQMYEDRTKELGVGVEMVGAILEAAEKAGCRI